MKILSKTICCVGMVFAVCEQLNAGQVNSVITQAGAVNKDYGMIKLATPVSESSLPACAQNSSDGMSTSIFFFIKSGESESHGRDLLSIALAGLVSGKTLSITYSGSACSGTRALISRIDILR